MLGLGTRPLAIDLGPGIGAIDLYVLDVAAGRDHDGSLAAFLQTLEDLVLDFAWNMQVEDEILQRLEKGGKGTVMITASGNIEHIQVNSTDPWTEVDGERSSTKTKHPLLSDPAVRQALGMLVDRKSVEDHIYGRTGVATGNFLNNPERVRSKGTTGSSMSRRRASCWKRRAGRKARTVSGPRTARS